MSHRTAAAAGRIDLRSDAQRISAEAEAKSAPTVHRLWRRALSLGAANAFDYGLQFLLPLVLVRCLDTAAFGHYRLLWLAVGTVTALATLAMPPSLYYFLPRSDRATKRLYINQTLLFLVLGGLIAAWIVSPWNPWLPLKMRGLAQHEAVVPVFVLLWVVASLLDMLPMIEERVMWQTKATVGLAVLRAGTLSLTAILTRELEPVLLALLVFVVFKLALLLTYIAIHHGLRRPIVRWDAFIDQVKYAAPFGASGALYELRGQADQWVAAALFPLGRFASFSIAAILAPLLHLFRQSVNNAFLPSMSRLQAAGDLGGMMELNSRANVMVGSFIYPLLAFAFVFAEDIVTLVYTAAYVDAAPVMRVYTIGFLASVVELATVMLLMRQGGFMMRLNLLVLPLSVLLSWYAAHFFGFAGAAAGSVTAMYIDRIVTLRRIALRSGVAFRRLQDWPSLGRLMLSAALAAMLAWGIVVLHFGTSAPLVRLAAGGVVLTAAYAAVAALLGVGRNWLAAMRNFRRDP
jgi:O-antigen/teichoic acid export membrane protein